MRHGGLVFGLHGNFIRRCRGFGVHSAALRWPVVVSWSQDRDQGLPRRVTKTLGIDVSIRQTEFEASWSRTYLIVCVVMICFDNV